MWTRLARLPWWWRWLVKWILLGLVTAFVLYPHLGLLLKQVRHLRNVESLIQPDLPEVAAINRELDAQLATNTLRRDEFKAVERYVYQHVPYKYDWVNWGNLDYWPTAAEVLERKCEDCDGRAVLATSILRARGFRTAHIVANLNHVWVAVDQTELLQPAKEKNLRRVGGKTIITLPGLKTWLGSLGMICEFPAFRSLILIATALVLAYHPCRNVSGLLAVSTTALIGFVLLLDWGHRLDSRGEPALSLQLMVAFTLMGAALGAALLATRWLPSVQARITTPPA